MAIKPILDVLHFGKRVTVHFATRQRGLAVKYDIFVNDIPIKIDLFAEEVMCWLAEEMIRNQKRVDALICPALIFDMPALSYFAQRKSAEAIGRHQRAAT
jgi:hypothetical protein